MQPMYQPCPLTRFYNPRPGGGYTPPNLQTPRPGPPDWSDHPGLVVPTHVDQSSSGSTCKKKFFWVPRWYRWTDLDVLCVIFPDPGTSRVRANGQTPQNPSPHPASTTTSLLYGRWSAKVPCRDKCCSAQGDKTFSTEALHTKAASIYAPRAGKIFEKS